MENKGRTCCSFGPLLASMSECVHLFMHVCSSMGVTVSFHPCMLQRNIKFEYVLHTFCMCALCIAFATYSSYMRVSRGYSPAARCSCCLDGVDSEAVGNVPQRLHCLLVRFVVILHEGKMSSSSAPEKWTNYDPLLSLCVLNVCV